jgi:hypothetical protein
MLAMTELAKSWPTAGWILRLFINLMKKLTAQKFRCWGNRNCGKSNSSGDSDEVGFTTLQNIGDNTSKHMSTGLMLNAVVQPSAENGQLYARSGEMNRFGQTEQLMSDVIWASDQNNFDFDFMFRTQSNSLFPFSFDVPQN